MGVLHLQSAAGEGTDTDGPTDILMRRIVDAFGEYERLIIKARTKAALAVKKSRGERCGGIPYGFELAPDGVTLVPCPAEQQVLDRIKTMRKDGMTLCAIADELNARAASCGAAAGNGIMGLSAEFASEQHDRSRLNTKGCGVNEQTDELAELLNQQAPRSTR